jgi:hypothetical protein
MLHPYQHARVAFEAMCCVAISEADRDKDVLELFQHKGSQSLAVHWLDHPFTSSSARLTNSRNTQIMKSFMYP